MSFTQIAELPSQNQSYSINATTVKINGYSPVVYIIKDETVPEQMYRFDVAENQWQHIPLFEPGKVDDIQGEFSERVWVLKGGRLYCWQDEEQRWENRNYNLESIDQIALSKQDYEHAFVHAADNHIYQLNIEDRVWEDTGIVVDNVQDIECTCEHFQSIRCLRRNGDYLRFDDDKNAITIETGRKLELEAASRIRLGGTGSELVNFLLTNQDTLLRYNGRKNLWESIPLTFSDNLAFKDTSYFYPSGIDVAGYSGEWVTVANNDHLFIYGYAS